MLKINISDVETVLRDVADTVILPHFRDLKSHEIHFKGEDDPVTDIDLMAEKALTEHLRALLPNAHIVGEENCFADPSTIKLFEENEPVWIIDPIDGTKAYIAGEPVYGMIVALAHKKETLAAWLYDPNSHEFITAEKGAGAWHKGKRLSALDPKPLPQMEGTLGSQILDKIDPSKTSEGIDGPKLYRMLSACHDYARLVVHESHFSGNATPLHFYGTYRACTPWDNAAGTLINDESGGYTAHWTGESFKPFHRADGVLTAPDKTSWMDIRNWVASFCPLPDCGGN